VTIAGTARPRSRRKPAAVDLAALLPSWELHLRAERKSAATVKLYATGVRRFLAWAHEQGLTPELSRDQVRAFTAAALEQGQQAATVRARQLALRRFSAWLLDEGETTADELLSLRSPKLDIKHTARLSDEQLRDLLAACKGNDLRERRDDAVIRLMAETGMRAGEAVALEVGDVDLSAGQVVIRRGKGGKARTVPIQPQTAQALDRYLRSRRTHRLADSPALWLGDRGKGFSYDGLYRALTHRANLAGIEGFHPHLLRHTAAQRWLDRGGSEGGLMAIAGWTRPDMLLRYTRATAAARAVEESRRLNLGDL
jgi:integrase/recombinase XerD